MIWLWRVPLFGRSISLESNDFQLETNMGAGRIQVSAAWKPLMMFVIPIAVAMVLLLGLGLI